MKSSTFTIEEIEQLEKMSKEEIITSFNQYSAYTANSLALLTNITTLDKALYIGVMLQHMHMKAKDIVKETSLTKSHVSRLGKVGKWALNNKEQYQKLVDTAGTKLSVRAIADAITHDTIKGVDDWASLVEKEKAYKKSTKASTKATTTTNQDNHDQKPTSDKATPTEVKAKAEPSAKPKNPNYRINDYERMNSTCVYQAIMRLINAYEESSDNLDYMNAFIERLNVLKH